MSAFTKKAIKSTFLELLNQKTLDKITVKDIVETCGINRNTFYYYYADIYDLLEQLFREEAERVLADSCENSGFYEEFIRTASIVLGYRQAVIHLYNSSRKELLERYLKEVTFALVSRFVKKAAKGHSVTEEDIQYITHFYGYAIIGITMNWIHDKMPPYRENFLKKLSDSFEATINDMILDCERTHA
ncbi:MAG: TetR-like C-terminal domain-containing protein [Blautia sp.]|nr:TetR-like C-terminal domain-containing protein [Eubacteriales bacterium]MED9966669.1 TetR-like C-terminal domain-containing protein [Blautia sp.]